MLKKRLTQLRKEYNLKQEELAKIIGVARTTYAMYEQGHRNPDYDTLSKLADYYGVNTDYLLGRTGNPKGTEDEFDSMAAIKEIVDDLGIEDLFFHNIDDIKNLSPEAVEDIRNHLEYTIYKERQRRDKENRK